jgi:hypothetical protein
MRDTHGREGHRRWQIAELLRASRTTAYTP